MSESKTSNFPELLYRIFINFDKPFRVFAPGFLIIVLLYFKIDIRQTLLSISGFNLFQLLFITLMLGMCYYSIHRTIFAYINHFGIKNKDKSIMESNIISFSSQMEKPTQQLFYIYNASIHLASMCFELIIIFHLIIRESEITKVLIWPSIIGLCLCLFIYFWVTRLQYEIKIKNGQGNSKKSK